ncbi:protein yellow-like [Homalodisca vitripennis]|uniref:protein yellow-like n=1 Tax=Homalodisca vitripennis TaxID=197043 RepID=UPI001EEBBCA8|nr:protein yellow-like [Homalodisca vitripennis]
MDISRLCTPLWLVLTLAVGSYGFSVDPSFGGKSVYASAPSFGGKSVYAPAPSFGGKSVYAPAPSFGGKSVYAPASIFGGKSVYTPAPSFGGKSVYAPSPSYVAAPAPSYVSAPTPAPGYYPGLSSAPSKSGSLVERFRWRFIDYDFPSAEERYAAMAQQLYIPENNLPVGIEIWNNKLFVSVPRWAAGVPATLNYLPLDEAPVEEPKLIPYPDWASNRIDDCDALTTTYRIRVDECDRLWVLDSGTVGIGNTTQQVCPYAYHVFDLRTNKRIRKYQLKDDDINADTFIANIAVDVGKTCDDTFVYASDELGYGLIVYNWLENDSWRLEHGFFQPDPLAGDFNVGGINFQWSEEGIFGMSLSAPLGNGFKTLFFHALASNREFSVSTEILRNKAKKDDNYHDFVVLPSRGPGGHVTSQTFDSNGVLFYNLVDQNAVGCWDSKKPYSKENLQVVARDDVGLIFPSDVRVDRTSTLWVISDRMPIHLEASLDFRDVNFRIFFSPVRDLIAGTVCDSVPAVNEVKDISQYLYYK